MYTIKTLNAISPVGLAKLPANQFEIDNEAAAPQGILVRSADMHEMPLPDSLLAIARAGAGTNNIPVEECTSAGIVVFNTPGANANSVMELALCGMLLSSRDVVGGINWVWVGAAVGAAVSMVYVALFVIGYNTSRVTYWLNPWAEDPLDKGYQLRQSLITIGSGGLWGLGLGKSRQKFLFLPEEHNDFIFSIVCEELGLVGAGIIMLLFAALILRGYWIALHTRDRFGTLLAVGFTTQLAVQVFLNIGVVTGLLPTTGISLPFFSYGGTALLIQLAEMGVILSVSRQMKPTKAG